MEYFDERCGKRVLDKVEEEAYNDTRKAHWAVIAGCWRKLAEIGRMAALTQEPDPDNAGVGIAQMSFPRRTDRPT